MKTPNHLQLFEDWARDYDSDVLSDKGRFPFTGYEQILDRVVSLAEPRPKMRILDLGIGTGNLAARFIDRDCEVCGLDFSAGMLAQTHLKLPGVELIQADLLGDWAMELQTPFDRVVSAYVFHEFEFETKIKLLRQIGSQCLAPGGRILVADIAFPDDLIRTAAAQYWQWEQDEYYWAADEARAACELIGLRVAYEQISNCGGIFSFTRKDAG